VTTLQTIIDLQAAHRAVLEEPFRDEWRLAYADAREDMGLGLDAEFLRDRVAGKPDDTEGYWFGPALPNEVKAHQIYKGFVSGVSLACGGFQRHARELFSSHPIIGVILTDRHAGLVGLDGHDDLSYFLDEARWPTLTSKTDRLPHAVYELLEPDLLTRIGNKGFTSPERANRALSQALVRYGRGLVQPPLPELVFPKPEEEEKDR